MTKRWLSALAVLSAAVISCPASSAGDSEDVDSHLKKAAESVQQKNTGDAEREYQNALRKAEALGQQNPKLIQTLNQVAEYYKSQGKQQRAQTMCTRAIKLERQVYGNDSVELANSLRQYSQSLVADGRSHEADAPLREAMEIYARAVDKNSNSSGGTAAKLALADCIDDLVKVIGLNEATGGLAPKLPN